jgi:hypothetical protein
MTDVPGLLSPEIAKATLIEIMEGFDKHPIRSAEGFRNAALDGLFAFSPMLDITDGHLVNSLIEATQQTIREGRMIDFGFLPNAMLKETSTRTRDVFEAGELQHPYEGGWLGVSSWEGGMCGYYVSPPLHPEATGTIVVEIYGIAQPGLPMAVVVNDLCNIEVVDGETMIRPAPMIDAAFNRLPELSNRSANMLDPLVTMLRILSDASVPIVDVPAPVRLNKQRALKGKSLIPPHTRVETRDYVSTFQTAVTARRENKGGHHASPVPHWRRSHQRHLVSGKVIPVRSTKVNWRDTAEMHRLFSRVKKVTP